MKKICVYLFLLALPALLNAQVSYGTWGKEAAKLPDYALLDSAKIEIIYYYRVIDRQLQNMKEYHFILQVGDSVCQYENYGKYRLDSVLSKKTSLTNGEWMELIEFYNPNSKEFIIENFNKETLSFYGKVSIDYFAYQEPMPQINWNLSDSTRMVCGYLCHLATASFRGRNWNVWYCDIPKNVGPWKLNGTPGLILRAETTDQEHLFEAISLRKANSPICSKDADKYFKTSRIKYNSSLCDYMSNPGKYWNNTPLSGKDENGKPLKIPKRKLFFNPIEKE